MDTSTYWFVFISAALAINLAPGPDLIYILSKSIAQGKKVGVASSMGIWTGAMVHVLAASLGLSTILATSATAFSIVKYIGAGYLVYMGIQTLFSKTSVINTNEESVCVKKDVSFLKAFRQGVLVDILNPKAAIFFMAFLPQFVRPELGHSSAQIFILGILVIVIAMPIELCAVFTASSAVGFLKKKPSASFIMDKMLGSVLLGLGLKLAFTRNLND